MTQYDPGGLFSTSARCKNHSEIPAVARCTGCADSFCSDCLIEIQGQKYCGSCKVMAVKNQPVMEEATIPCKEANDALTTAIIGIFCFWLCLLGFVLGPMAISKALKAKKMIETNPQLTGSGKATAALIIGILVTVLTVIGLIANAAMMGSSY